MYHIFSMISYLFIYVCVHFFVLFILLFVHLFAQLDLSSNAFVRVAAAPVAHFIWILQCVARSHELNPRRSNPVLYFALQSVAVC